MAFASTIMDDQNGPFCVEPSIASSVDDEHSKKRSKIFQFFCTHLLWVVQVWGSRNRMKCWPEQQWPAEIVL